MSLPVDSLGALQAFVHAAEGRSFKLAGQQMGLSSSAVGKAVQRLEEQLGVRLFHRTTRSITLTEEGSLFLERSQRVLDEMEAARAELAQSAAEPRGRLKVSLPVAPILFTPLMAAFMEAYPAINLDLDFNDRMVDVVEEGFDAVIRSGEAGDSRLQHRKLGEFRWRLVASPAYLERAGAPLDVCDLADHDCLRHRYPATGKLEPWLFAGGEEAAVPATLATTLVDPLLTLAEAGRGIASLPDFLVRDKLAKGSLVEVLPGRLLERSAFRLLWPSSRYPSPKVRAFVDFLAERMRHTLADAARPASAEAAVVR